jgi:hypothetical protein
LTRFNPAYTSLKTLNITYQTPQETLLTTPVTLPTSEPATPQVGYTIANAHLPTLSLSVYNKVWVAHVYAAGKFVTAGTLYWRMKKNGSSIANGSTSVGANTFYTVSAHFYDVNVGDILEIALWSSVTDSNYDYKALAVSVTRIIPFNKPRFLINVECPTQTPFPTLTLGNPSPSDVYFLAIYSDDKLNYTTYSGAVSTKIVMVGDTYGLFQKYFGDNTTKNSANVRTDATYRPKYDRDARAVSQFKFRGLRVD